MYLMAFEDTVPQMINNIYIYIYISFSFAVNESFPCYFLKIVYTLNSQGMDGCVYYLERLGLFLNIGTWLVSSLECLASCFVLVAYVGLAPSLSRVLPVISRDCARSESNISIYFFS
jgi:hypothetical protein